MAFSRWLPEGAGGYAGFNTLTVKQESYQYSAAVFIIIPNSLQASDVDRLWHAAHQCALN
jgi:hypothetical protein